MKSIIIVLIFFCTLLAHNAAAIKVSDLYQATVPVVDETASSHRYAIKQALIQVLVKLTGDRNISNNANIGTLLARPEHLVQQFRYRQADVTQSEQNPSLILWVQFEEAALNEALDTYGLPIWGSERPSVLVWLAHEDNRIRRLASFEDHPEYLNTIDQVAVARGVAILFPLFDLEDNTRIRVSDVWGDFKEPLLAASSRYQADVLLIGKIIQTSPDIWEARWSAYSHNQDLRWTTAGTSVATALTAGVDELADRLAAQYAIPGSTITENIQMTVTDINNLDEYAKTLSYLASMQSIKSVQVKLVAVDKVVFDVVNQGGLAAINQSIALGKTLAPVGNGGQLIYRLLPK